MIKKVLFFLFTILVILLSCEYKSPYSENKDRDLITNLDLLNDWNISKGIALDVTQDSPYAGETGYYFDFLNLITKYSNFEEDSSNDLENYWHPSPDNSPISVRPDSFEIVNDGEDTSMGRVLHIKLQKNPEPQYVAYRFNALKDYNYLFKFDFRASGDRYQLSYGDVGDLSDDLKTDVQLPDAYVWQTILFDIVSMSDSFSEIRFGFKDPSNDAKVLDFYVDNLALFIVSNINIMKEINISGSTEQTDDKTGETFYEGIYRLTLYAKSGTSDTITLNLGTRFKEITLSSSWQEISLEAQILKEQKFLSISIMPSVIDETKRFPGGIYITKPKLYFLPNKSSPDS